MKRRFFAATVGMCLFFGMGILFMAPLPVFAWEEDRVEVGPSGERVIYKNLYRDVEAFIESIEAQEKKSIDQRLFYNRKPTHGVSSQEPYKPMTVDLEIAPTSGTVSIGSPINLQTIRRSMLVVLPR